MIEATIFSSGSFDLLAAHNIFIITANSAKELSFSIFPFCSFSLEIERSDILPIHLSLFLAVPKSTDCRGLGTDISSIFDCNAIACLPIQ